MFDSRFGLLDFDLSALGANRGRGFVSLAVGFGPSGPMEIANGTYGPIVPNNDLHA